MSRTRATVSIDDDVLRATRIAAARSGKRDSEVVEEALRIYLGLAVVDRVRAKSDLSEAEAQKLVYREIQGSESNQPRRTTTSSSLHVVNT